MRSLEFFLRSVGNVVAADDCKLGESGKIREMFKPCVFDLSATVEIDACQAGALGEVLETRIRQSVALSQIDC